MRHPLSHLAQAASLGMASLDVASRCFANLTGEYYASDGWVGYGTQILMGNGASPETFEAIAFVKTITPGDMTTGTAEKTHLRSIGAHREWLLTLRDSGPFVLELQWVPKHESQSNAGGGSGSFASGGLIHVWRQRLEKNYQIICADGSPATEWSFRGGITKFQPGSITGDETVNCTAEIKPLQDSTADLP